MINVNILLGGMTGGIADMMPPTNTGMYALADWLRQFPDTSVKTWTWGQWIQAGDAMLRQKGKHALIGYSGGGTRATYLADTFARLTIDLMVAYDPSPAGQMKPVCPNVIRAMCYHNTRSLMWWPGVGKLGGGLITNAPSRHTPVERYDIAIQHLAVQFNKDLHARTVQAVRALAA